MSFERPTLLERFMDSVIIPLTASRYYRRYAESLHISEDASVLEFGSGSGRLTRYLARNLARGGGRLVAIDTSAAWTATAKKRLRKFPRVSFVTDDVRVSAPPAETFDVAVVHFALHDIPAGDRPAVAEALAAALKYGGTLFIREPARENHGMAPDEIRRLLYAAKLQEKAFVIEKLPGAGMTYNGEFEKIRENVLE